MFVTVGEPLRAVQTREKPPDRSATREAGQKIYLASLYPDAGLGEQEPRSSSKAARKHAHRYPRQTVYRRRIVALGHGPRSPEKRDRPGRLRTAQEDSPLHPARPFERAGGPACRKAGRRSLRKDFPGSFIPTAVPPPSRSRSRSPFSTGSRKGRSTRKKTRFISLKRHITAIRSARSASAA